MHGRDAELRALDTLVAGARNGAGGCLLVTAPPGLGRTALTAHAVRALDGHGLAVTAPGHPAESRLPGAALDLLTAALTRHGAGAGPGPGATPAARAAGLLDQLHRAARTRPLLLAVDDVHHWDGPSRAALGIAARRLGPHGPAALLLTADSHHLPCPHLDGLPELRPGPLTTAASAAVVRGTAPCGVHPAVLDALVHEALGNPGRLTALVARLTPDQLTGRDPLPSPLPATPLLRRYTARLCTLPRTERPALLLLAAEDDGDIGTAGPQTLQSALSAAGCGALPEAERTGIVLTGADGVPRFTDPLWRTAVLRSASPAERRAAHQRLARASAEYGPHLAHLWHTAAAAPAADRRTADILDAAARTEARTSAPGPLAALLTRAAELGPQTAVAADRYTRAAEQARLAGRHHHARLLLARADRLPRDPATRGRAAYTLGMAGLADGPVRQARAALGLAAGLLAGTDPLLALDARRQAAEAAWTAGDQAACRTELAELMGRWPESGDGTSTGPGILRHGADGAVASMDRHYTRGIPALRRAVADAGHETRSAPLAQALAAAAVLGDAAAARDLAARAIALARSRGHAAAVPHLWQRLAFAELYAGCPERAGQHARHGLAAAEHSGQDNAAAHHRAVLALAAATRGDAEECADHAAAAARTAGAHGLATASTVVTWALARLDLTAGRPDRAASRLLALTAPGPAQGHFSVLLLTVPCLVEACARTSRTEEVRPALREFTVWATAGAGPHARALAAHCHARLAEAEGTGVDTVARLYREALALHTSTDSVFEQARTALQLGKALRRHRRPALARHHLREALVAFEHCGARPWAEDAGQELRAAGAGHAPGVPGAGGATAEPARRLTAQQEHIAQRAAEGATNNEIARDLSLSPRTIEHHLRNIFASLGIRSRTQLGPLLAGRGA
ncbi:helix-turn-helix transcriptional regulator [Kitasatospora sp. NE20-6]|uniref:AAA family ATPase n=1 Tax=Kitasatospora sp. NE20-6 TaxID=2859066 RepID=UPI0034DBCEAD